MSQPAAANGPLGKWIEYVFDHPVVDPAWHWATDAPEWVGHPAQVATYIAETFEDSGRLLAQFSDEQLEQAFWFLVSNTCSQFMYALVDPGVPISSRLRALRSFVPLFEQVMAARCSPHLAHLDEQGANPLNNTSRRIGFASVGRRPNRGAASRVTATLGASCSSVTAVFGVRARSISGTGLRS